eukprot:Protomagalhaensia_sp_Gyna_25__4051@NODE_3666_length_490_cov_12_427938_g3106_i0_p1_GENE_NODE_3666_length_490_cov_12_427938_g3106_i0NODE_3666_length_490_cov_12_427938_g3106_i0_p1_ORF_typecomplete_len113_score20_95_NODE_3666_length_490_cov_12_427938_g3106_i0151453
MPRSLAGNSVASEEGATPATDNADVTSEDTPAFPYGFPMPFYLCQHYGGLPVVLDQEDGAPMEGQVWLKGQVVRVGIPTDGEEEIDRQVSPESLSTHYGG